MQTGAPIGVFDSGVGGLTVVAAIRRALPNEPILYLGDTARVPYGTKSKDVVSRYARNCARFLVEQGAKMVVVACNTASAYGLVGLTEELGLPVVGVIEPGAKAAVAASRGGRIGVIGTEGTIASGSYQNALTHLTSHAEVHTRACPLFVPLAEEGMSEHPATLLLASEYLQPLVAAHVDTLVLGCTHYPLLTNTIRKVVGPDVAIVDSATAVATEVGALVKKLDAAPSPRAPDRFFATDVGPRFRRVGEAFLGDTIGEVQLVDL